MPFDLHLGLPTHSWTAMVAVIGLLLLASLIFATKKHRSPQQDFTELGLRIQSWWWMIALLFAALAIGRTTAIVFFAFISFLALKEFLSITPTRLVDRRAVFWAYVSIPVQYYFVSIGWFGMFIIFIPIYMFLFLPMRMVLIGETSGFIRSAAVLQWGVMLTVFCLSHIAYLLVLPIKNADAGPVGLVLFVLFTTQFNDVCQYLWGKALGKHKIIPKVSPNKTWEGFLGGLVTTTISAGFLAPYLTPLSIKQGFAAGFIIACAGFIGDVVMSSVKRDLQIKDSGNLIPGHGGVLDRLDSLSYTAPLFFHFIYYFQY